MKLKAGLYIISTPIGNMGDITERAVNTLRSCDYIFAEDTRVTKKLLVKHQITTRPSLYNDHSDKKTRSYIKDLIEQNMVVGLVSDAGTPLISDPGYKLVRDLRIDGCHIDIVPGACAPIAALTLSGLPSDRFIFCGFIPKTSQGKKNLFQEMLNLKATLIFFETANRLHSSLEIARQVLGNREAAVVREITKVYQTVKNGYLNDLTNFFSDNPARGEIVLLISGEPVEAPTTDINTKAQKLLNNEMSAKTATEILYAQHPNYSKKEIYHIVNSVKAEAKNK